MRTTEKEIGCVFAHSPIRQGSTGLVYPVCLFSRLSEFAAAALTALAVTVLFAGGAAAATPDTAQSGIRDCTSTLVERHNPGLARPSDKLVCFEAYISNFDTDKADVGNRGAEILGVPHWVSHHVKRVRQAPESRDRPRTWFTVPELAEAGIAPTDGSYRFSQKFRGRHPNWFERGHLAQKYLAERVGEKAGWFTHNLANAVPQRSRFNKGPWLALECYTGAWANRYGEVWVIAGPIFTRGRPTDWLRSDSRRDALPVAVPDALFKIVARESSNKEWAILAFIYPQDHASYRKGPWDPAVWLTSVGQIERVSGQQFLPGLGQGAEKVKNNIAQTLWSVQKRNFDPGCRRFAKDIQ